MDLWINRQNRTLVSDSSNNIPLSVNKFYQNDIIPFNIKLLDPSGSYYSVVNEPSSSINISLGIPGIITSSMVVSASLNYSASIYTGSLSLSSSNVINMLSGSLTTQIYFETEYINNRRNTISTVYQQIVDLNADLIK